MSEPPITLKHSLGPISARAGGRDLPRAMRGVDNMLYKVTPMMAPPEKAAKKPRQPGEPRKKRKSAVYDHEGHEVLITLMCLKCRSIKPLAQFGLRKMADGAIRNQPWCRPCRSGAGVPKPKEARGQGAAATAAGE